MVVESKKEEGGVERIKWVMSCGAVKRNVGVTDMAANEKGKTTGMARLAEHG